MARPVARLAALAFSTLVAACGATATPVDSGRPASQEAPAPGGPAGPGGTAAPAGPAAPDGTGAPAAPGAPAPGTGTGGHHASAAAMAACNKTFLASFGTALQAGDQASVKAAVAAHDACLAAARPATPGGVAMIDFCIVQLEDGQAKMVGNCTGCTATPVNNDTQAQLTCGTKTATTPAPH